MKEILWPSKGMKRKSQEVEDNDNRISIPMKKMPSNQ